MAKRLESINLLLSASIFCLAGALVYFAFSLTQTVEKLPGIVDQLDEAARFMYPVLDQVELVTDLVPDVIEEVEKVRLAIPPILEETEALRSTVPPILAEVESVRNSIPPILEDIEKAQLAVSSMVDESAEIRDQVPLILEELDAYRTLIAAVIVEVQTTRASLPGTLDRAEYLIAEANAAGQEASEGAITGVLTGILKAPFTLISSAGGAVFASSPEISDDDREILAREMRLSLTDGQVNASRTWINSNKQRGGEITIVSERYLDDRLCRMIRVTAFVSNGDTLSTEGEACLKNNGDWETNGEWISNSR